MSDTILFRPGMTQARFEQMFDLLDERGVKAEEMSAPKYAGALVKAAIDAGWIEPLDMQVADADPALIWQLHNCIRDRVNEIMGIPKN